MPSSRTAFAAVLAAVSSGCFADYEKSNDSETTNGGSAGSAGSAGSIVSGGSGNTAPASAGRFGGSSLAGAGGTSATGCSAPNPVCAAGDDATETDSCGNCAMGKKTRTRQCQSDCTWGAWSSWSACNNPEECVPGTKDSNTQTVSCPCGGSKAQQRTCASTCTWGAWTDTSACDISCCATLMYCDTPDSVASGRGTWCRRKTAACSRDQTMDDCMSILRTQSCVVHEPVFYDEV